MSDLIGFRETTSDASPGGGQVRDAVALRFDPSRRVNLRFQIVVDGEDAIEALRYARRSMIREERTRGLEWDEPSMEDPSLSGSELRWYALASQAAWCREKVGELVERANRALAEIRSRG
ncbi:MAG TPA: hypothetical protein VMN82_09280 [Thermoanaerobaculia bacterium]|nr:hypothetical protein [Thermoanaerobaculia bacterium]